MLLFKIISTECIQLTQLEYVARLSRSKYFQHLADEISLLLLETTLTRAARVNQNNKAETMS